MGTPRKRPRDFSQAAKLVIDIASGQIEDRPPTSEERGKDRAAAALVRASLPDGTADRIEGFKTEGEGGRWVRNE